MAGRGARDVTGLGTRYVAKFRAGCSARGTTRFTAAETAGWDTGDTAGCGTGDTKGDTGWGTGHSAGCIAAATSGCGIVGRAHAGSWSGHCRSRRRRIIAEPKLVATKEQKDDESDDIKTGVLVVYTSRKDEQEVQRRCGRCTATGRCTSTLQTPTDQAMRL